MKIDLNELKDAFVAASRLARIEVEPDEVQIEIVRAPHRRPASLPHASQVVYCFLLGEGCLKVGKAGPKTQARFTSQHYGDYAPSTLAKSILKDRSRMMHLVPEGVKTEIEALHLGSVGAWLEKNTERLHVFLPISAPPCVLDFAEAFLQCWLRPIYEGKNRSNPGDL